MALFANHAEYAGDDPMTELRQGFDDEVLMLVTSNLRDSIAEAALRIRALQEIGAALSTDKLCGLANFLE